MPEDIELPISKKRIELPTNTSRILKDSHARRVPEAPKTLGSEVNFRATDGSYHSTTEGLHRANEDYSQRTDRYKSGVLGREYPVTPEGARRMREDEAAYWESQKITKEFEK